MRNSISLIEMYRLRPERVKRGRGGGAPTIAAPSFRAVSEKGVVASGAPGQSCFGLRPNYPRPRRSVAGWVLLIAIGCLIAPALASAQCPPLESASRLGSATAEARALASSAPACRFDPILTRLFTPHFVPGNPYHVYVTTAAIEKLASMFAALSPAPPSSSAWQTRDMDPLEAFGEGGPYDPAKVGRLYVGRRARVVRGPIVENGQTVVTIMLVSPYPDPSLTRLEPGTMIVEFRVPPVR